MSTSSVSEHGDDSPQDEPRDRINRLFATIRPDGGTREYTNVEIAALAGITDAHVSLLRNGQRNPSWKAARKLEAAFGLTEPYILVDDPSAVQAIDNQLEMYRRMRDGGVLPLALRALDVETPEGLAAVSSTIEQVVWMENERRKPAERIDDGTEDVTSHDA